MSMVRVKILFSFFKHVQTVTGNWISDRCYDDSSSDMKGGVGAEVLKGYKRLWEQRAQRIAPWQDSYHLETESGTDGPSTSPSDYTTSA